MTSLLFAYLGAVPQAQSSPHKQGLQEQFDSRFLTVVSMIFVFMLLINVRYKAMAARRRSPYAIQGKIYIIFGLQPVEIFSFIGSYLFKM
jgi:hypothetical protein